MGMYTELNINIAIADVPEVINILKRMIDDDIYSSGNPIDNPHPLFKCERLSSIFHCTSYYFPLSIPCTKLDYDNITKHYYLSTVFNLKNYDDEIEKFLDWLCPYITTEGYLGTFWYEEWELPNLIFKRNGGIEYVNIKENGRWLYDINEDEYNHYKKIDE